MTWTAEATVTTGQLMTASFWNTYVRDDINALNRAPAASTTVAAAQTTTSTSYADLSTVGPTITLTTGTDVWMSLGAELNHNGVRHYMAVAISGATTRSPDDSNCLLWISTDGYADLHHAYSFPLTGLTPGSNTFTCKYKTSTGTASFGLRTMSITHTAPVS